MFTIFHVINDSAVHSTIAHVQDGKKFVWGV